MLNDDNVKRIAESKLNIKKVNLSCLFVGAIPSYEPSGMFADSLQRRSSQAVPSGKVLLEVRQDATEEVRQEEKTAQPIFLLASSNLGDEILRRRRRRIRRIPPSPRALKWGELLPVIPSPFPPTFPALSPSDSLGIFPLNLAGINGGRIFRGRFPLRPAALSPSRRYKIVPRASLLRFRRSPLAPAVGFVLAPCTSLFAVAAELRSAAAAAPDFLLTRRHLHSLRRVAADPVRRSASSVDCRSTVALGNPNRAVAFLRSGSPPPSLRSSSRLGATSLGIAASPSTSSAPPFRSPTVGAPPSSSSRAAPPSSSAPSAVSAAFAVSGPPSGAPSRLPSGPGRQPPAPAGAADARDPRRRPPPAACARSTVDRAADAWAPPPVDPTLQLRKIRSSWKLKPAFGKASKASHIILEHIESQFIKLF
uniref:HGWP repeat containing protein-like n=1 Tax=Oryza sativa subsp. japonica TaxID=39947 RepID=Q5Z639_ORYSJ|nr:HGWP repeat containing protein-like [Oryza sativa Japonica Group]